jgi:hypothetical protein
MNHEAKKIYDKYEIESDEDLIIFFVSKGKENVVKAVQYEYVGQYEDKGVYNLGFGDYNLKTGAINDAINNNNGDERIVLNTVLSTIPAFFEHYPEKMLLIRGSDSAVKFKEECNKQCHRKCGENCRKFNQRIRIYRNFVDLNFDELSIDYQFYGGFKNIQGKLVLENYIPGKDYIAIYCLKK